VAPVQLAFPVLTLPSLPVLVRVKMQASAHWLVVLFDVRP
jgi:hypothetical protein